MESVEITNISSDLEDHCELIHSSGSELSLQELTFDESEINKSILEVTENIPPISVDLVDADEKRVLPTRANQRLKLYAAQKIIRKNKKPCKKNYFFLKKLANSTLDPAKKPLQPEHKMSKAILELKQSCTFKPDLPKKENKTLPQMDERTSEKISKVVNSGNLTINRFKRSTDEQQPLVVRKQKMEEKANSTQNFPKAIVYPHSSKTNIPPTKQTNSKTVSYNEIFTKEAVENSKVPRAEGPNKQNKMTKSRLSEEPSETKQFKYLIPQDILASETRKSSGSSKPKIQPSVIKTDVEESSMPERPKINYELIDALADYRVIARYLFTRLNIQPMDFDGTDDYINLYKFSRN